MQIIVNRSKSFSNGTDTTTVSPGPGLQEVPDWVRDTNTFKLGIANRSIMEIEVKSASPALPPANGAGSTRFRPEVPTVEEVVAAGYSPEAAAQIVKQQRELAEAFATKPAGRVTPEPVTPTPDTVSSPAPRSGPRKPVAAPIRPVVG